MHFKQFSDEFINKWLTEQDKVEYKSSKDKKIKAGVNWLTTLNKKSFQSLDKMYLSLNEMTKECLEKKCREDFDWIINHGIKENDSLSEAEKSEKIIHLQQKGFENIRFLSPNIYEEGIQRVKNYHKSKKICYEKLNLFRAIMIRLSNKWNDELNVCLNICKNKPLERNNELPDCFTTCMIEKSYQVISNEYYLKFVYEKLKNEFKNDNYELPEIDLLHSYRLKQRELNDHIVNKFL